MAPFALGKPEIRDSSGLSCFLAFLLSDLLVFLLFVEGWVAPFFKLNFPLVELLHSLHTGSAATNASHPANLFTNSREDIYTNGKAPLHSHINLQHPTIPLFPLTRR